MLLGITAVSLCGCSLPIDGYQSESETILPPRQASLSPNYAPESITTIGVLPLFPRGTANDWWQDQLVHSLASEVASRQPQWHVVSPDELLRLVSDHDLLTGYRNLEADYNTYAPAGKIMMLSPATKAFLDQLREVAGVDAVLVGGYNLSTNTEPVTDASGRVISYATLQVCDVSVSLIHAPSQSTWWVASAARKGNQRELVVRAITQTLATHIGKGTRQQL